MSIFKYKKLSYHSKQELYSKHMLAHNTRAMRMTTYCVLIYVCCMVCTACDITTLLA